MDLDILISKAHKLAPKSSNEHNKFIAELQEFEQFMEDNAYDLDALKHDTQQIRDGYLSSKNRKHFKQAKYVFNKITSIINPSSTSKMSSLLNTKLYNKFNHFTNLIDFKKNYSAFVTRDESYITVDKYVPDRYRFLKPLEKISVKNNIPLSDYLITGYHSSGLQINEYIAENELFNQLKEHYNLSPNNRHYCIAHESMTNYLIEYEKHVCKPLNLIPKNNKYIQLPKYNDDITIIINYIIEINNGINKVLSQTTAYPVQFDVFFVAPNMHNDLNLHSLKGLNDEIKSDLHSRKNGAVDAICDIYNLLRRAANNINKSNGQRFIMLIVRNKLSDTSLDTVYIYKPCLYNTIPPEFISNNVELTYLLNSKLCPIINNLQSTDNGILGLTHHLHSTDCNKIYLSYSDYKSRVFKHNFLNNLSLLFKDNIIGQSKKNDFHNSYKEFIDFGYKQIGEYWFNNNKSYECFEPYWNPQNCRAMGNVYIPKRAPSCTHELLKYIDENNFESPEKLYYKMDYTIGMQIVDKQTIYIKFGNKNNKKNICLINTELHRHGQILYAVIIENTFKSSKQKWKIINYKHISEAFMTPKQLINKYGIFICDLPVGSKTKHNHFIELKNKIQVTKQLIRTTNWSHIRIVQSRQNLKELGNHNNLNGGALEISERRFKQLALKSLQEYTNTNTNKQLTPIAHFKFRKNKYHLEKLLPVYIPEHDKYVAISFCYNQLTERGKTQASGVCLDLVDMKNKANLVEQIPNNSWLNKTNNNMTINNLIIGQYDTPPTKNLKITNTKKCIRKKNTKNIKNKILKTPITPPSQPKILSPQSPSLNSINVLYNVQHQLSNISTNIPPQLIHNSSIGSIDSMQSMQSMQTLPPLPPLPPIPSMPLLTPIPSVPTYQNVQNVQNVQNTIQCNMQQCSVPNMQQCSVPNMPQCSVPNMQQLQQNAQYFANFLPSNFLPSNFIVNTSTAVHSFYNNTNATANYGMQYNQNQYNIRYN